MAKNGKVEKNINVNLKGTIDIDEMSIVVEKNVKDGDETVTITNTYLLEDYLREFDGKFVTLTCKYNEDLEEELEE